MSKKYFIFSDSDLDGICSYITLSWFLNGEPKIPYKLSTVTKFRVDIEEWLKTHSFNDYDKIFILDMDISNDIQLIDHPNVIVIDHHKTHIPSLNRYDKAKYIIKEFSSATKLIYNHFQKTKELNNAQKLLIALADDYDSYMLKVPQSYDLHIVYYQTQNSTDKTKVEKFIECFGMGFNGFTEQQQNIAKLHRVEVLKIIDSLSIFGSKLRIQQQDIVIRSTICERATNEVADHLIRKLGADVAIVVNPRSSHVSFRRRPESKNIDVSKIASQLTEGGGHEYAAGGQITDKFIEFTKLLQPIK